MPAITLNSLSGGLQKQVKALKGQIGQVASQLRAVREKASDLAPKVMKLFNQIKAETEGRFSLADFARFYDPKVPERAEDYRRNPTYAALDYMQRVQRQADRPRGAGRGRREPATAKLERTLKTILQIVKDPDPIWQAVQKEFQLEDRGLKQLQNRVNSDEYKPLLDLTGIIKPVNISGAKVIHMEPKVKPEQPEPGEVMRAIQGVGKRGRAVNRRVKVAG
jgi:hypothetical protein